MNSSDQTFFDLAIKVIGGQATPDERAVLNAQLAADPALKAEFEQLKRSEEHTSDSSHPRLSRMPSSA